MATTMLRVAMRSAVLAACLVGAAGLPAQLRRHNRLSGHHSGAHPVTPSFLLENELKEQVKLKLPTAEPATSVQHFQLVPHHEPVSCGAQLGSVKDVIELEGWRSSRDLKREEKTMREKQATPAEALARGRGTAPSENDEALAPTRAVKEITVLSEHANCPDAQCPRAKVYNIGYIAKGYNIIYGNPYPESAGIDSGFTKFGGGGIFQLTYDQGRETVDGREEVPDDIVVMAEHGCTLQMTMSEAKDSEEYQEMVKNSNSYGGSVGYKFIKAAGKASSETKKFEKENDEKHVVKTYSEAMCDSFRVKLNKYSGLPKFTGDFATMVTRVVGSAGEKERAEAFYDLFDNFGTHYLQGLTLGSKFVLNQNFEHTKWNTLTEEGHSEAYELSVEVALEKNRMKKKAAKKQKAAKRGCSPGPNDKKKDPCGASTTDWIKETVGLIMNRLKNLELNAKAEVKSTEGSNDIDKEETTDESDSRTIISIGAPPSDDALEWAKQSVVEAMPIKYSLAPLCDLFDTTDAELLKVRSQSKELLGGMDADGSAAFVKTCMSAMQTGYCSDRVSPREGGLLCEGKMSQRAKHSCSKDADCGTQYECVNDECKLPYTRVVELKLVGVAKGETMPACPADFTAVMLDTEAARLGCPSGQDACTHHSQLCMLKKDSTKNLEMPPICQLFLANDKPQIDMGMSTLKKRGKDVSGEWGDLFAQKVLFETCAGCKDQSGWVGQGEGQGVDDLTEAPTDNPLHKYLWTESKTCEAYLEPRECKGFLEFDTCDLSAGSMTSSEDLLKCDEGDNKIGTNRMGVCVCSPELFVSFTPTADDRQRCDDDGGWYSCNEPDSACSLTRTCKSNAGLGSCACPMTRNVAGTAAATFEDHTSNPFFCGHPSTLSCYDYCRAACRSSTIAPAITDIVASATHNCPDTYEVVRMNGNGNSNLYAASPVDTDMFLCIQRMSPERAEGQTRIGDSTNGRGSNAPQSLINNLETTRRIKPNNHHRVEKAIEHFVERSEAQSAKGDTHLHRQASKAGGLARVGGALAGALEASRPPEHISNALHESVTNPGSIVHPMKGVLKTEKDEQEQALDELESAVLREVSLLQVTERRADGALENPDVNAVLGMGAIGEQRETQLTVKSQSAVCPDAQCPRSKVVNLGYIAKGYNLLYGNPNPKGSGIDPGFTNYGGSDIFKLTYNSKGEDGNDKDPKQTADGRYEVPTALDVVSEHGCSLSFSSETASTVQDYQDMQKRSTSFNAGINVGPFFKASFKASDEFEKNENELTKGTKTTVKSEARCSAYSARLSRDPEQHAAFSDDFLAAVDYLTAKEAGEGTQSKEEAWYDFFDTFGTHFISWMVLGSRYTMQQIFVKSDYDELTTTTEKDKVTGDVALGIGPLSASAEYSDETTTDAEIKAAKSEDKSDRIITALGAPPADTELEWAKQSKVEAMPIDMSIEDICDLFGNVTVGSFPKTGEKTQALKTTCSSLLTFSKYCKKRVAPRAGVGVCSAVSPIRKSHTCEKDSDCGNSAAAGEKSFECVDGVCILAYTRIFDMHLAFQTPCPTNERFVSYTPTADGKQRCGKDGGWYSCNEPDSACSLTRTCAGSGLFHCACPIFVSYKPTADGKQQCEADGGWYSCNEPDSTCNLTRTCAGAGLFDCACPMKLKFEDQQYCDGEPVCEPGYEKVQKVDASGSELGVANLNEYLDGQLSEDELLDTYTTHICVRKVSTTSGRGLPTQKEYLVNYGKQEIGAGFPVCQAFLSKAARSDGEGYMDYWEHIGQKCGSEDGEIPISECDHKWKWLNGRSAWKMGVEMGVLKGTNTHNKLSRVQGVVGCLQRGPGAFNQKHMTRASFSRYKPQGNTFILDNMGGISDVNLNNVRCYEARAKATSERRGAEVTYVVTAADADAAAAAKLAKLEKVRVDAKKAHNDVYGTSTEGRRNRQRYLDAKADVEAHTRWAEKRTGVGFLTGNMDNECGRWGYNDNDAVMNNGGAEFYKGGDDDQHWAKHCPGAAPPKHLWFQSGTCEKVAEPMKCVSFTQVDCNSHSKQIEVFQCDNNNQEAPIAADQAGFCTCSNKDGEEIEQEDFFMCHAHPPTSCQEYCLGKDPQPGVTDMVMVSSADQGGAEPKCPDGYERVQSINKGNGGIMTALNDDLNEGRNREKWPYLYLCQTFALTSKTAASAMDQEEAETL